MGKTPCNVCGKDAIGRYTPDMDIKGLGYCKKHKKEVQLAYMMILQDTPDMARKFMKGWKYK